MFCLKPTESVGHPDFFKLPKPAGQNLLSSTKTESGGPELNRQQRSKTFCSCSDVPDTEQPEAEYGSDYQWSTFPSGLFINYQPGGRRGSGSSSSSRSPYSGYTSSSRLSSPQFSPGDRYNVAGRVAPRQTSSARKSKTALANESDHDERIIVVSVPDLPVQGCRGRGCSNNG